MFRSAINELRCRNNNLDIDKFPAAVTAHFREQFSSEDAFNQIPVLSIDRPPDSFGDGSLVAFYAMVQDTSFSPELYLAKTSSGDCGGWGLNPSSDEDHIQYTDLRESSVFWAVSIPGLSPWCIRNSSFEPKPSLRTLLPHKFPVAEAPHIGVQLKIYDDALAKPFRATDISCFVGFLASEPLHSQGDVPEPLNVPTLHVLFSRPLPTTVLPRAFPASSLLPNIKDIRRELIQWLADEALEGDIDAAEWVFLATLAKVQSRHPPILPLSLTLSGFPPPSEDSNTTPTLHHLLSLIFPLVTTLPLSLSTLNNTPACPESKDEDLHSGWLQLPKGSISIFTEAAVSEGNVSSRGIMNIRAAQEMMNSQTLDYIFPFSSFQFETDVNFIVLTSGKQSTFFKTNLNIPFKMKGSIAEAEKRLYKPLSDITLPSADKMSQFRQLVGGAQVGNVTIGKATGKHVEDEFVKERSEKRSPTFTQDDLIQRMLVSRLISFSFHETEVTIESWTHAKNLEKALSGRSG